MYTTNLRKVGGSVMLALPPSLLEVVDFQVNTEVGITVQNGCLIVEARKPRRYSLQSLIDQCDPSAPPPPNDPEWLDMPTVGAEVL